MEIQGWYYLHSESKDLIYKAYPDAITDIRESDLCHSAWAWNGERLEVWSMLVEAFSLGARPTRIAELATKWHCDDADAKRYAKRVGVELGEDGNAKTAKRTDFLNLQESPCGFGDTYLEAMADLCRQLGYRGGKMWNATFQDLLKIDTAKAVE